MSPGSDDGDEAEETGTVTEDTETETDETGTKDTETVTETDETGTKDTEAGTDETVTEDTEAGTDEAEADDGATVSPDFEAEFPSVTAGSGPSESPSVTVGSGPSESPGDTVDRSERDTDSHDEASATPAEPPEETGGDGLGWQGWVLVGALVVAMGVVPWAIVFLPAIQGALGSLGLGLRDAYLVLPMIPALGLGVLAVWAAVAYRRREN